MRLKVSQLPVNHHKDMVTACCWSPSNELYAVSDDHTISKWNMDGEFVGKVADLDEKVFITDMKWFPSVGKQQADSFAMACTDGTFRLMSRSGREEKKVTCTTGGAAIALSWNYDGTALATAGEDGSVKVWSRSGNLRSPIAQVSRPVYSVVWGPDNDMILFASGPDLTVKNNSKVGRKQVQWKAHDGVVMKCDWNPVTNLIVSCGEDCKYKVWDSYGRQLFSSKAHEHVITSIEWSPNGSLFAVGSYNLLRLCDKTGWSYSRNRPTSGSVMNMCWTADGTQLVGAGGNGAVLFGQLVDHHLECDNVEATLVDTKEVKVQDILNESVESLDFRDRVVQMALGFNHLVVATATQCFIYNTANFNTPHIFDLPESVTLLLLADRHFVAADNVSGVKVYDYEGRVLSNPRFAGLRTEFLNSKTVSVSRDSVAILDRSDSKQIRIFSVESGKQIGSPLKHTMEIEEVALSRHGQGMRNRLIVFVDKNRDLYISRCDSSATGPVKLHTMVDAVAWNDQTDMLCALADGKTVVWNYPMTIFIDTDLLPKATVTKETPEFGKIPQISSFDGNRVVVRRSDGTRLRTAVSPYPRELYNFVSGALGGKGSNSGMSQNRAWEEATRLCRFVKQEPLWAALAAMAISSNTLDTAETALAALNEVDKLHYVQYIKEIPSQEGRSAELAMYRRCPQEAEKILLQTKPPLLYRAIKLNIRSFNFTRALQLAEQHRQFVDVVLAYRARYMKNYRPGKKEFDPNFLRYENDSNFKTGESVDWEAINAVKEQEKEKEANRSSGGSTESKFD